jgi:hypothetical protein
MPDERTPEQQQESLLHSAVMQSLESENPARAASYLRAGQNRGMTPQSLANVWEEVLIDQPELPETMQEFLTQNQPQTQPTTE